MDFWILIFGVIVIISAFPYVLCFLKRLGCLCKIRKICRIKNFELHPTHSLWFLGSKRSLNCDFYIETINEVFAIKLFGMKRLTTLILQENGNYIVKRVIGVRFANFTVYSKPRALTVYDFHYRFQNEWMDKKVHFGLLINPISMDVCIQEKNGLRKGMYYGDVINGIEIYSLSYLLKVLDQIQ